MSWQLKGEFPLRFSSSKRLILATKVHDGVYGIPSRVP